MVETKRVIIISHPEFDGPNGITETKNYAHILLEGIKATRDQEKPDINAEDRAKFEKYLSQFKVYTRKIDRDIL